MTSDAGYYSVGHFSKFVQPRRQAHRLEHHREPRRRGVPEPQGSLVLIIDNTSGSTQPFSTSWAGQKFNDSLPSHGIATYEWTPA